MFNRHIINDLDKWLTQPSRKHLILRGARQVGKTTLVKQFASRFEQYIYLNLELPEDRQPFEQFTSNEILIQTLFFIKNYLLDMNKRFL